ncbi:MarR family winged helix-turn-helix transcriptional regulator [Kribbella sp. NBC_01484]|uniref:MarR family winged helix-turn-helix transcriptional regulator n=1 Tax=Kribbella sp. NBC_01484 TaxID=2903579 RepID=UPI002E327041|nr:MarR family winged helix-turn-helix transcriptional regulator [Kribbella sp. NBC_01484]
MTSVNDLSGRPSGPWPDHIAGLLGGALRRLREEILAVSDDFPGLRVSHYRLLELIPPDGARITDLAEVALMTKQALGQHVDYLQGLGYTESDRLRADRRVRLVRRTARGEEAVAFSRAAIERVEALWADQLGPERYEEFREILRVIGA